MRVFKEEVNAPSKHMGYLIEEFSDAFDEFIAENFADISDDELRKCLFRVGTNYLGSRWWKN